MFVSGGSPQEIGRHGAPLTPREFFVEREAVRRGHPASDSTIAHYRFCNIRPSDDYGDRYLRAKLEAHAFDSVRTRLFNILLFRWLAGAYWTFEDVAGGWVSSTSEVEPLIEKLTALQRDGVKLFGRAHMANRTQQMDRTPSGGAATIRGWLPKLQELEQIAYDAESLRDVFAPHGRDGRWGTPNGWPGIGGFIGFQVCRTLTYMPEFTSLDWNTWVFMVHNDMCSKGRPRGSSYGMQELLGGIDARLLRTADGRNEQLLRIYHEQDKLFREWHDRGYGEMTLVDLEHGFCEHSKHCRFVTEGPTKGGALERYVPRTREFI